VVKKLLLGLGVVVLAIGGPVVAWQFVDEDRRAAALGEATKEGVQGTIRWRGEFNKEVAYEPLDVVSFEGSSYVATTEIREAAPPDEPWNLLARGGDAGAQGLQGPAGTLSGTLASPTGKYSLVVADDGIVMQGPGGSIKLQDTGAQVIANRNLTVQVGQDLRLDASGVATVKSGAAMTVEAGGVLHLKGSLIRQN
jgi:hypothetical protein